MKEFGRVLWVKSVRIRSYSGPYFPVVGLTTERHYKSLRIKSKSGKKQTRITLNAETFYAMVGLLIGQIRELASLTANKE